MHLQQTPTRFFINGSLIIANKSEGAVLRMAGKSPSTVFRDLSLSTPAYNERKMRLPRSAGGRWAGDGVEIK